MAKTQTKEAILSNIETLSTSDQLFLKKEIEKILDEKTQKTAAELKLLKGE